MLRTTQFHDFIDYILRALLRFPVGFIPTGFQFQPVDSGEVADALVRAVTVGPKGRLLDMVQVNCSAVVHLTHVFAQGMVARRRGDILILASTASFQAVPYISTYAATKAFDLLFAEGLAEELKPYGIRVCALCPGSTESEFHVVAGQDKFIHRAETAQKVARTGLRALAAGKSYVISGLGNYLGAQGERLVPRRFVTRTAARMFQPKEE